MNEGTSKVNEIIGRSLFLWRIALDEFELNKPKIRIKQVDSYYYSDISVGLSG